jgi:hypothetical protein
MIKKAQLIPGTKFKIYKGNLPVLTDKIFEIGDGFISQGGLFGSQMNIEKMGSRMMKLYTFNMVGIKSEAVIRYEDIEIITE